MPKRPQGNENDRINGLIKQWNQEHLDLFTLSSINENGEFHGVIRFYFQDDGAKVSTKCIRVASTANVRDVIDVLVEKFRPDMKMLTPSSYSLYEVHVNGDERKLDDGQKPLHVQLEWGTEGREGRFLLKKDSDTRPGGSAFGDPEQPQQFKRKLSKREKKEQKKKDKERLHNKENESENLATKHYTELPETSFTRSISNPEAVMKRQRQQKLEKKLAQIHAQEGPHSAGTLKIYGEQLSPHVPYKTLLLSASDTTAHVLRETMAKYGLQKEDPTDFYLLQILIPHGTDYHGGQIGKEFALRDEECPLAIAMAHSPTDGTLVFAIRRKSVDQKLKAKTMRAVSHEDLRSTLDERGEKHTSSKLPFLVELYPDGSQNLKAKRHRLPYDTTEIGSDPKVMSDQCIIIPDQSVDNCHCVINHSINGVITIAPTNQLAEVFVNNTRINDVVPINDGMIIGIGRHHLFRFRNMKQQKNQTPEPKPRNRSYSGSTVPHDMSSSGSLPRDMPRDMTSHMSRDMSRPLTRDMVQSQPNLHETTFDVDGHVESNQEFMAPVMYPDNRMGYMGDQPQDITDALPVAMEFRDDAEDQLLMSLILDVNDGNLQFKLAPTYSIYMVVRYRLSTMYRPEMTAVDRANNVKSLVAKVAQLIQQTIQNQRENPSAMSFWMANSSELLHFFKQDHDVHPFTKDAQEMLAECVQISFYHLVWCLQNDFKMVMSAFVDPNDDVEKEDARGFQDMQPKRKPYINDVLNTLSSAMHLLRRCRVNAALTIQLFSQLFHFINMWLFNTLVTQPQMRMCTVSWGIRLKRRLRRVEAWAEEQGLELAAECHLCRIVQAAHLLQAPKNSQEDIDSICSTCFKLNSLQLRVLLENYIPEPNEPPVPNSLIAKVVNVANNMADAMLREDGREILLEEDADLQLPFLLPEDGYSAEAVTGVPKGLTDFLDPLVRSGLCRVLVQPAAQRDWTVYMHNTEDMRIAESLRKGATPQPMEQDRPAGMEVIKVTFNKVNNSMGLSIVAAKGETEQESGIYIKSVVPQGAADIDGRLKAGDQLIEVDGHNLIGISQESAADLMKRTGHTVTLKVGKQGAIYHGLAKLLSQPSPIMQRGKPDPYPAPRTLQHMQSEEAPPPYKAEPSPFLPRHMPYNQQYSRESTLSGSPRNLSPPSSPGNRGLSPKMTGTSPRQMGRASPRTRDRIASNLHQARSSPALNTSIDEPVNDRLRSTTSTQNIPSTSVYQRQRTAHPPVNQQPYIDNRSQSTSNLQDDPASPNFAGGHTLSSSGINHPPQQPWPYQPQSQQRDYNRAEMVYREPAKQTTPRRDYENQMPPEPIHSQTLPRAEPSSRHNNTPKWTPPTPIPPIPFSAVERLGVGKRPSPQPSSPSSSQRSDTRPKSSYEPQVRSDVSRSRPKSDDIDNSKVREWQERNSLVDPRQMSPNSRNSQQFDSQRGPSYPESQQISANDRNYPPQNDARFQPKELNYPPPFQQNELNFPPPEPQFRVNEPQYPNNRIDYRNPGMSIQTQQPSYYENMAPGIRDDPHSPNYANQETMDKQKEMEPKSPQSYPGQDNQRLYVVKDNRNLQDLRNRFPPNSSLNDSLPDNRDMGRDQLDDRSPTSPQQGYYAPPQMTYPQSHPQSHQQHQPVYYNEPIVSQVVVGQQIQPRLPEIHPEEIAPPLPPPPQESYVRTSLSLEERINAEQERMLKAIASKNVNQEQQMYRPNRDSQRYSGNFQPEQPQFVIQERSNDTYVNTQPPIQSNIYVNSSNHNYQNISKFSQPEYKPINRERPLSMTDNFKTKVDKIAPPPPIKPKPKLKPFLAAQQSMPVAVNQIAIQTAIQRQNSKDREHEGLSQSDRAQLINQEITELEALMPRLSQQQDARLQNLRLEQEFQRRLEEAESRGDEDSDDERAERRMNREMLHHALQDDIEKTKQHLLDLHRQQRFREFELEKERMERLTQRLKVYEEDVEHQKERQARREEIKRKQQEEAQRKQREQREKQRADFEENKKRLMREEEDNRQRQEAEAAKRKEWEREKLQEIRAARDAEENSIRAEIRRQEEEATAMRLEEQSRQKKDRRITVTDEIDRLDNTDLPPPPPPPEMAYQYGGYQRQGAYPPSFPSPGFEQVNRQPTFQQQDPQFQTQYNPPQPSSYNQPQAYNQAYQPRPSLSQRPASPPSPHVNGPQTVYPEPYSFNREFTQISPNINGIGTPFMNNNHNNGPPLPPERTSSYEFTARHRNSTHESTPNHRQSFPSSRSMQDISTTQKKSVSFNSQLETRSTYSVGSTTSSQRPSLTESPVVNNNRYSYTDDSDVFTPQNRNFDNTRYTAGDTPTVIGAQEIYRDPRNRIDANRPITRKPGPEKMSFKDKMSYFAKEAGESTPKERPKSSRSQRDIESQIFNGN